MTSLRGLIVNPRRALYDVAANDGFVSVSVGVDHDTPVFAVTTIEAWWKQVGS